jgi:hypothetical protein
MIRPYLTHSGEPKMRSPYDPRFIFSFIRPGLNRRYFTQCMSRGFTDHEDGTPFTCAEVMADMQYQVANDIVPEGVGRLLRRAAKEVPTGTTVAHVHVRIYCEYRGWHQVHTGTVRMVNGSLFFSPA